MGANLFFQNLKDNISKISQNIEEIENGVQFAPKDTYENSALIKLVQQEADTASLLDNAKSTLDDMKKSRYHSEQHYVHLEGLVTVMEGKMSGITNYLKDYGYEELQFEGESENRTESTETEMENRPHDENGNLNNVNGQISKPGSSSENSVFKTPTLLLKTSMFGQSAFRSVQSSDVSSRVGFNMPSEIIPVVNTIQKPRSPSIPAKSPTEPLLMSLRKNDFSKEYENNNTPEDTVMLNSKSNVASTFQPSTPEVPVLKSRIQDFQF